MFGVILWTDGTNQSGIIWCEDQQQLAYFRKGSLLTEGVSLAIGDFVTLDVQDQNGVRFARNVVRLGPSAGGEALGERLKRQAPRARVRVAT